nr:hypothetical protein Iba_chr06fCG4640 [Ipomoea batatas]
MKELRIPNRTKCSNTGSLTCIHHIPTPFGVAGDYHHFRSPSFGRIDAHLRHIRPPQHRRVVNDHLLLWVTTQHCFDLFSEVLLDSFRHPQQADLGGAGLEYGSPAKCTCRTQRWDGGFETRDFVKSPTAPANIMCSSFPSEMMPNACHSENGDGLILPRIPALIPPANFMIDA